MLIAVSQRTHSVDAYQEQGDYLDKKWHAFFKAVGITPLLIPNDLELLKALLKHTAIDGVLLTGGDNNLARVEVEHFLLEHAIARKLPLIGVCHGMQMIQKYYGVKLCLCEGQVKQEQTILINGEPVVVNSYHRHGAKSSLPDLMVWAKSMDGVVKAIQHKALPIFGIMWHPERMQPSFLARDIKFFKEVYHFESHYSSSGSRQPTEKING